MYLMSPSKARAFSLPGYSILTRPERSARSKTSGLSFLVLDLLVLDLHRPVLLSCYSPYCWYHSTIGR